MLALPLPLLLLSCVLTSSARVHWSLADDLYAFPKYRVSFLNGQPVLNETAERWLQHGLNGGEREFLDQPWSEAHPPATSARKEIEGAEGQSVSSSLQAYVYLHIQLSTAGCYGISPAAALQAAAHEFVRPKSICLSDPTSN